MYKQHTLMTDSMCYEGPEDSASAATDNDLHTAIISNHVTTQFSSVGEHNILPFSKCSINCQTSRTAVIR